MNASANLMKKYFKIWANLSTNIRLLKFIRKIGFNFSLKFDANLPKNLVNFVLNFKKYPNFSVNPCTNLVQISKADKNTNDFKFNEQISLKPAGKRS